MASPARAIEATSSRDVGRAAGSRARHGATRARSRERRHAGGCCSTGSSHGYERLPSALSNTSDMVVSVGMTCNTTRMYGFVCPICRPTPMFATATNPRRDHAHCKYSAEASRTLQFVHIQPGVSRSSITIVHNRHSFVSTCVAAAKSKRRAPARSPRTPSLQAPTHPALRSSQLPCLCSLPRQCQAPRMAAYTAARGAHLHTLIYFIALKVINYCIALLSFLISRFQWNHCTAQQMDAFMHA